MVCMAWQLQVLKVNCFNPLQCSSNCLAWPRWLEWQAWILRLFFLGPSSSLPAGVVVRPWKVRNARGEGKSVRFRLSRCGKVLARNSIWSLRAASDGDPTRPSLAMSNPIVIQLNVSRSRSSGARSRCPAGHLRFQSRGSTTFEPRGAKSTAFLHYDSCWHTGGIKTKTGGIDPT